MQKFYQAYYFMLGIMFSMLAAKTFWPYVKPSDKSREPASYTYEGMPEDFESRRAAVETYGRENLEEPEITDELIRMFKEAALSDPSIGDDGPPLLTDEEAQLARDGLALGLLNSPTEDLVNVGRELGQYSKGLLEGPVEFRSDPEFRCISQEKNSDGEYSELLVAKPVYVGATYVRYRPHTGLSPHGISDFATILQIDDVFLTYSTVLKDDPENQIELRVYSNLNSEAGSKSSAELSGIIDGDEIKMAFYCTRGKRD